MLDGNNLAVIGKDSIGNRSFVWTKIYDISNKSSPSLTKDYKLAGDFNQARKVEKTGFVYIKSQMSCSQSTGPLPWYNFGNGDMDFDLSQIFYFPTIDLRPRGMYINLLAFNLRDSQSREENVVSVISREDAIFYMSEKSIYFLFDEEMNGMISTRIQKVNVQMSTMIPTIDGIVTGRIFSRSMVDQFNGILRISTVKQSNGETSLSNNVFCLNSSLKVIGSLTDILTGNLISAAYFAAARLYLGVSQTNNQFFIVSLLTPQNPKLMGGLNTTDEVRFFDLYNTKTVITIGKNPSVNTSDSSNKVYKISLIDVTYAKKPAIISTYTLPFGVSYFPAEIRYRNFLFSKQKNLLNLPVSQRNSLTISNITRFDGALVLNIMRDSKKSSIELRAIVNPIVKQSDYATYNYLQRSVYIGNMLYTKSRCLMRIFGLETLDAVANLNLGCEQDPNQTPKPVASPVFNPQHPLTITGMIPVVLSFQTI